MGKFNIGDYVTVISLDDIDRMWTNVEVGMVGEIVKINNGFYHVDVIGYDMVILKPKQMELFKGVDMRVGKQIKVEQLKSNFLCDFYRIGDITLAVPKDLPIGIETCHDDDEYCEDTGKAIAFQRLIEKSQNLIEDTPKKSKSVDDLFKEIFGK